MKLKTICSCCAKLRDDETGEWGRTISKLAQTWMATYHHHFFSHGICRECQYKCYPEVMERVEAKNGTINKNTM